MCVFVYLFWGNDTTITGNSNKQAVFSLCSHNVKTLRCVQDHYFLTFTSVYCLLLLLESFFNITESLCASHLHNFSSFPGGLIFSPIWKVHDSAAVKHPIFQLSHVLCACGEGVLACPVHPVEVEPPDFETFRIHVRHCYGTLFHRF